MVTGVVIINKNFGLYLGGFLGLGFFSGLDCAGQESACVFETAEDARCHILSWDETNDLDDFEFVPVTVERAAWATIKELESAGLGSWLEPMRQERQKNFLAAAKPMGRA